jgi:hypothetical protein
MGILPMSLTGVPPVSYLLLFLSAKEEKEEAEETTGAGKMPVRLMGGTPMLRILQGKPFSVKSLPHFWGFSDPLCKSGTNHTTITT